jgi:enterochelin esterase-like enzyme
VGSRRPDRDVVLGVVPDDPAAPARHERLASVADHRGTAALLTLLSGMVLTIVVAKPIYLWFRELGLDDDRAVLLMGMVVVLLASTITVAITRRAWEAITGAIPLLAVLELTPLIGRHSETPTIVGLPAPRASALGWSLAILSVLFLGFIAAGVGVAVGNELRAGLARLGGLLGRRPRRWLVALIVVAMMTPVALAAAGDVQLGPAESLYTYGPVNGAAQGTLTHTTVGGRSVTVYVPAGLTPGERTPVLYLLHGFPSVPDEWLSGGHINDLLDQLIAGGAIPPTVAVMPDGNGADGGDTEWSDLPPDRVETWMVNVLMPTIEKDHPSAGPQCVGVLGFSAGGYGAVNLALRNPTRFGWAASFSGYFIGLQSILGDATMANDPTAVAANLPVSRRMPLYLASSTGDPDFDQATHIFARELQDIGWSHLKTDFSPGQHDWSVWRSQVVSSLQWMQSLWTAGGATTCQVTHG